MPDDHLSKQELYVQLTQRIRSPSDKKNKSVVKSSHNPNPIYETVFVMYLYKRNSVTIHINIPELVHFAYLNFLIV